MDNGIKLNPSLIISTQDNIPASKTAYKIQMTDISPEGEEIPTYPITRGDDVIYLSERQFVGILHPNESVSINLEALESELIALKQKVIKLEEELSKK